MVQTTQAHTYFEMRVHCLYFAVYDTYYGKINGVQHAGTKSPVNIMLFQLIFINDITMTKHNL